MTLLSPLGAAAAELLADATVTAITTRIRTIEPAPGDAKASGSYVPFVVLTTLDTPWQAPTATSVASIGMRCYAATFPAAPPCLRLRVSLGEKRIKCALKLGRQCAFAHQVEERPPQLSAR